MLSVARTHFDEHGVLLVDTPAISRSAVSDPNIESVDIRLDLDPDHDYFLHTSPEFCMKRMLAAGFPDIAQICRVFRDAESGRRHQPEFTMIEWYRLGFDLDNIMQDAEHLITALLDRSVLEEPPQRLSYRQVFQRFAGIDPLRSDVAALSDRVGADDDLIAAIGDDRDAWLDLVMATCVARRFDTARLTTVYHYPCSQAALARRCPADPSATDRFEIYFGDLELANGYVELSDPTELTNRFEADQKKRRRRGAKIRPLDTNLIEALQAGLPACAGVAAGFDRLLMINVGSDDIRDVQHFPHGSRR